MSSLNTNVSKILILDNHSLVLAWFATTQHYVSLETILHLNGRYNIAPNDNMCIIIYVYLPRLFIWVRDCWYTEHWFFSLPLKQCIMCSVCDIVCIFAHDSKYFHLNLYCFNCIFMIQPSNPVMSHFFSHTIIEVKINWLQYYCNYVIQIVWGSLNVIRTGSCTIKALTQQINIYFINIAYVPF